MVYMSLPLFVDNFRENLMKSEPLFSKEFPTHLISGSSAVFYFGHYLAYLRALENRRLNIIDCAIRFNVFHFAEFHYGKNTKSGSVDQLLQKIFIQRAFTPYQILDAVKNAPKYKTPVLIFAPCKQFLDGDVALDEGLYLLEKLVSFFQIYREKGYHLMLIEKDKYSHPVFTSVFPKLKKIVSKSWALDSESLLLNSVSPYKSS